MAENSKIEWTHHTFNPWRGCTKVSAGCAHCYAEMLSKRNPRSLGVWGPQGARVVAAEGYWREPLKWNAAAMAAGERRRVFCASLADVFEGPETMPADSWPVVQRARERLFRLIEDTRQLDWLLLTKRPENAARMWWIDPVTGESWSPPNVWLGTSVENQEAADERIPHLFNVPAVVRFLSCEPLLGPVDLDPFLYCDGCTIDSISRGDEHRPRCPVTRAGRKLGWVIAGGESGHQARPMHPGWARKLRDQCEAAGVPYLFKQWGEWIPFRQTPEGWTRTTEEIHGWGEAGVSYYVGKAKAGRTLDGKIWDEFPKVRA